MASTGYIDIMETHKHDLPNKNKQLSSITQIIDLFHYL